MGRFLSTDREGNIVYTPQSLSTYTVLGLQRMLNDGEITQAQFDKAIELKELADRNIQES
jgi:hypothetical protein